MISGSRIPAPRRALSSAWVLLIVLAALPALSSRGDASRGWKAAAVRGDVAALSPGVTEASWSPLSRGDVLAPGSLVRTGARARTTLVHPMAVLLVDPESRVTLPEPDRPRRVVQTQGRVLYRVTKDGRGFQVETPALVAGVKGTTFMVSVSDHRASVWVEEGRVEVFSPVTGASEELGAGDRFVIERDATSGEARWVRVDPSREGASPKEESRQDRREAKSLDRALRRLNRDLESVASREPEGDDETALLEEDGSLSGEAARLDDTSLQKESGTLDDPSLLEDLDEEAERVRTGATGSGGAGGGTGSGAGGKTGRVPPDPRDADLPNSSTPPGAS